LLGANHRLNGLRLNAPEQIEQHRQIHALVLERKLQMACQTVIGGLVRRVLAADSAIGQTGLTQPSAEHGGYGQRVLGESEFTNQPLAAKKAHGVLCPLEGFQIAIYRLYLQHNRWFLVVSLQNDFVVAK
jgi:hypothetical protein